MPPLCFGTAQGNLKQTLGAALDIGYRHIDGAEAYGGRESTNIVKKAIRTVPRDSLWITWKADKISVYGIIRIIEELDCEYIDLFLVHHGCGDDTIFEELKEAKAAGLIRNYGVSNCERIERVEELKAKHDIFANQIQARPPDGRVSGREPMPADFIERCNSLGVKVMLFGTISGIMGSEDMEPAVEHLGVVNRYYIQKYLEGGIVLMVASLSGSSLQPNYDDVEAALRGEELLDDSTMKTVESALRKVRLSLQ